MPSGAGFITFGDGRQAFVLPSLIRKMELQLGDELVCSLAPNFADKATARVPWRVITADIAKRVVNNPAAIEGMEPLTLRCLDFLEQRGGAWTAGDIAEEIGTSVEERFISRALLLLFDRGRVHRAVVEFSPCQDAPDIFYSTNLESLMPIGACEDEEYED
jgi:hypothetical protein